MWWPRFVAITFNASYINMNPTPAYDYIDVNTEHWQEYNSSAQVEPRHLPESKSTITVPDSHLGWS